MNAPHMPNVPYAAMTADELRTWERFYRRRLAVVNEVLTVGPETARDRIEAELDVLDGRLEQHRTAEAEGR